MPSNQEKPLTIIYIMGYGRSGSTLLDIILGSHPQIQSVGALNVFYDWILHERPCACSETLLHCPFWKEIVNDVTSTLSKARLREYSNFLQRVQARKYLSHLLEETVPRDLIEAYQELVIPLFKAIQHHSGVSLIVDSSKSARLAVGRVYALRKYTPFNVRAIHLVRDGRGVMWSSRKGSGDPTRGSLWTPPCVRTLRALWGWRTTNTLCHKVTAFLEPESVLFLRYEDLMAQPVKAIRRIGTFLEQNMEPIVRRLIKQEPFTVGHNIGGNRLRFHSSLRIQPDNSWRQKLSPFYQRIFWLYARSLASQYGYR